MARFPQGMNGPSRAMRSAEGNSNSQLDDIARAHLVDTWAHAVLFFDRQGDLMYFNRAGRDAVAASGLMIRGRTLKGSTPKLDERVSLALRSALGGSATLVRCDHAKTVHHWLFHPYFGPRGSMFKGGAIAITRIARTAHALELFAQAYELTRAEKRVLSYLMAHDASVETVAARAGIGVSTVRSHLSSLFQKTRTRHQRELVWLVLSLPEPPLDL